MMGVPVRRTPRFALSHLSNMHSGGRGLAERPARDKHACLSRLNNRGNKIPRLLVWDSDG